MKNGEDLWVSALDRLGKEHRQQFAFDRHDRINVLSDLQSLTETARDACIEKRWRFRRPDNGETVILRDLFGKIVSWINLFKQIGDNAVQYDPQHAALPWAGIRFVLQVQSFHYLLVGCLALPKLRYRPLHTAAHQYNT
jgi:hypothetical protein